MDYDDRGPPQGAPLTPTVNRYRFVVDIKLDVDAYMDTAPGASLGVQTSLEADQIEPRKPRRHPQRHGRTDRLSSAPKRIHRFA